MAVQSATRQSGKAARAQGRTPSNGYWKNGDLTLQDVLFTFSPQAQEELRTFITALPRQVDIEAVEASADALPHVAEDVEWIRQEIERGVRFVVLAPVEGLNPLEQGVVPWLVGSLLGRPLEQELNAQGQLCTKLYRVFDRGGRLEEGARYSYTNQGGDSHTDNVNTDEQWEYMLLTSVFGALAGGATTLTSGLTIHAMLQEQFPGELEILQQPILWERKGIKDGTFYEAPVITYNDLGEPLFRWLPSYAFQSNTKAVEMGIPGATPFTKEQRHAFDVLMALAQASHLQFQEDLPAGYTLIDNDSQVLHERQKFADHLSAVIPDKHDLAYDPSTRYGRLRYRMWVQKRV